VTISCAVSQNYDGVDKALLSPLIFVLSLISASVASLSAILNPTARWRRLRGCCCVLQSAIYKYRTRVDEFAVSNRDRFASQVALREFLINWRTNIAAGTDLSTTSMAKQHNDTIYKHCQREGKGTASAILEADIVKHISDDFHSPLKPREYIQHRLTPMQKYYQSKLPKYGLYRFVFQCVAILLTLVTSMLAFLDRQSLVAIVTAVVAGVTSWVEFAEYGKKLERYTAAIHSLQNLETWWNSLGEVEKASVASITRLVSECEGIIAAEYGAWCSAGHKDAEDDEDLESQETSKNGSAGGAAK